MGATGSWHTISEHLRFMRVGIFFRIGQFFIRYQILRDAYFLFFWGGCWEWGVIDGWNCINSYFFEFIKGISFRVCIFHKQKCTSSYFFIFWSNSDLKATRRWRENKSTSNKKAFFCLKSFPIFEWTFLHSFLCLRWTVNEIRKQTLPKGSL